MEKGFDAACLGNRSLGRHNVNQLIDSWLNALASPSCAVARLKIDDIA